MDKLHMLAEALKLQCTARDLLRDNDAASMDSDPRAIQWTQDRKEFAAQIPECQLDALTQLHSLSQAATALWECRESPEAIHSLGAELILGISSQITYLERTLGRTCDELGLFHGYSPLTGVH